MVLLVLMELRVFPGLRDPRDLRDPTENVVLRDPREMLDFQEPLELKAPPVKQGILDLMG